MYEESGETCNENCFWNSCSFAFIRQSTASPVLTRFPICSHPTGLPRRWSPIDRNEYILVAGRLYKPKQSPWPQPASELYRPSDRRFSAKLVSTFADRGCRVVSAADPYGRNLDVLDRRCNFLFEVAPQLYSRGWVDPVPDALLLRKSGSAGNRTRTSGSVVRNSDH
jgi:hypothetical protein